jgi:Putative adhesin
MRHSLGYELLQHQLRARRGELSSGSVRADWRRPRGLPEDEREHGEKRESDGGSTAHGRSFCQTAQPERPFAVKEGMRKTLFAAVLLFAATTASAVTLTERIDRTFDVRPGARFELSNVNGRINVSSWDQPRVRVIAVKEVDGDRSEAAEFMKALKVEMQPRDGGLVVITHHPRNKGHETIFDWFLGDHVNANVRYDVTLPRTMNVDITNTNGNIEVDNVAGHLEVDTTNGRIEVEGCSGSIDASTTNGGIRAELVQVAKGQPLKLETTNGRIEVAVPSNFSGELDASTTNGSIHTDFPITTTGTRRNSLRGKINGGGPLLRLRTTNGGIEVNSTGRS